ncbi:hypothetical protein ACSSS7_003398 [Eimeria intestinalis]
MAQPTSAAVAAASAVDLGLLHQRKTADDRRTPVPEGGGPGPLKLGPPPQAAKATAVVLSHRQLPSASTLFSAAMSGSQEASSDIYTVEKLVGFRYRAGVAEWRVRWQGYGPKDDTWESRKNLLMDSTFAFRHQMDQMERDFLERRAQASNRRANKGGATAAGSRAAAGKNKDRRPLADYTVPVEDTGTVTDSSTSSASDFSCPKESSSSSSSRSGENFATDSDSSLVGQGQAASTRRRRSSRIKAFSRRRRRCIDDIVEGEGGPSSGAPLGKAGGDPGLPASSDSEIGCGGALQVLSGKVGGVAVFSAQQGPLDASSVSRKHGTSPGASIGPALSPAKKAAAVESTPLRRLRYGGGEGSRAQSDCRSDASGGGSGAPSSSSKSSPEAETAGAPRAPTGFTVNEQSDDDVGPPSFFAGAPFDGVGASFAASSGPQTQAMSWAPQATGGGPPVSASLFQSPGDFPSNSREGGPGENLGWGGEGPASTIAIESTWTQKRWAPAKAPVGGGPPEGPPYTQDAAVRFGPNWGVNGDSHGPATGPSLSPVAVESSFYCKEGTPGIPCGYVGAACSTPPPEGVGPPHEGPCGSGTSSDAAVTPGPTQMLSGMGATSPFLPSESQGRGPIYSYGMQQSTPSLYGSLPHALDLAVPPDPQQQQLQQLQQQQQQQHQCRYQQVVCAGSLGPLGMSKGMLNRYPCESLYPGRVRVVKIVRGEAGGGSSEWLGGRGALVHYVIASSPGPAADPNRNVWGSCSIADARRFCPGALCDFLLRKALFRSGDKSSSSSSSKPGGGPPLLPKTNSYTCSSTSTASSDVAASAGFASSVSTDGSMPKESVNTSGAPSLQTAEGGPAPASEPIPEGGPVLLLTKEEPAAAQQQFAEPSAQAVGAS